MNRQASGETRSSKFSVFARKKSDRTLGGGFTIIEVIIVLAIASLIIVIVFLAVPALQRNSRNQSIKNDAGIILAGVSDFVSKNQGQLPNPGGITCTNGTVLITGMPGTLESEVKVRPNTECVTGVAPPASGELGRIIIGLNYKCNGEDPFQVANNSVVAAFRIENSLSGDAALCIEG